jgi:hypothetical protein
MSEHIEEGGEGQEVVSRPPSNVELLRTATWMYARKIEALEQELKELEEPSA